MTRKPKSRGNGTGCVYKRGRTFVAQVVVGWKDNEETGTRVPVKVRKGGFLTRKDAVNALPSLYAARPAASRFTLQKLYDAWEPFYSPRVGASTMTCYSSAFAHFSALHDVFVDLITAADLQDQMDKCTQGKRTHENMRCVVRLLWAYAMDRQIVDRDVTANLYIGKGKSVKREPLTEKELEIIGGAIGREPYADYVYALSYLGFRPGEFLALKKTSLSVQDKLLVFRGGSKTDAGIDRIVPVPPVIGDIVARRMMVPDTEYLFPMACRNRKGDFIGWKPMTHDYFNKHVFKPLMAKLGIAEGKTPYCARHSYSDKLKRAAGSDVAKASLMGHTDYAFTQHAYQSTDTEDLKAVALSIS